MTVNKGKTFTAEDVYRYFQLDRKSNSTDAKHAMGEVLYNLSIVNKSRELEQTGRLYRIIDPTVNKIEWWNAKKGDTLKMNWPRSIEDHTSFGFNDSIVIYPKDLIVIAGEGNTAKTTFCLNFMVENMDAYLVYYFTSEFNDAKFQDRMGHFDWVNIYDDKGIPKFILAEHTEHWQDVIQPNAINIIDWIYLDKDMFMVRTVMKTIISRLNRGIAIVVLQKRSYKDVGEGGEGTKDLASVYLTIRNDKALKKPVLKVEKVKTPGTGLDEEGYQIINPNFREWSFDVVQSGSRFHGIETLEK